ncbi:MAG: hypothetical protein LBD54_02545 [Puniceicoccales bacterium]|jgi:hypothetical protein|nr:hypothetical protein [Puniceicoccales bacterium]
MKGEVFMPKGLPRFFTATAGLTPLAIELCDSLKLPRFFTAEGFTDCFQKSFLRPSDLERPPCDYLPPEAKTMASVALYELCRRWGFLEEVLPRRPLGDYDALLVYALDVEGLCAIGHYLRELLLAAKGQGLTSVPEIFILTGSRPLTMEGEEAMAEHLRERHLPETEEWAARLLFRHALQDLGKSPAIVSVPMRQTWDEKGTGSWNWPDTRDTLRAFFSQYGTRKLDSLLAISLNPFISYQHAVGLSTWREKEEIDSFSPKEGAGAFSSKERADGFSPKEGVGAFSREKETDGFSPKKGSNTFTGAFSSKERTDGFSPKGEVEAFPRKEGTEVFSPKSLETVGPLHPRFGPDRWKSDEERLIVILLDNFARCAYEELGLLRKGEKLC